MRRLQLAAGVVVPHAPLLLEAVAGRPVAHRVVAAAQGLAFPPADVLVVASPHGRATGVYLGASGDLDAFGPPGVSATAAPEPGFARELAGAWGRPLLDEPVDHGVVVPLLLLDATAPVVAVAFAEGLDAETAIAEAEGLVHALDAAGRTVVFVASANTSAGLTERSPVPSIPGAAEAEADVLEALQSDPGDVTALLPAMARAGSCAAGPLAAFSSLCRGRRCELLAYEAPVGVGYAVAIA